MHAIKIHSNKGYLADDTAHTIMLYPFWGKNPEIEGMPQNGQYEHYIQNGTTLFEMTSLSSCDYVVAPAHWESSPESQALIVDFAKQAEKYGKKIILFFWRDHDYKIPINNSIIFRTSFYRSTRSENEHAMPAWSEDFLHRYLGGKATPLPKSDKPTIGFCGLLETPYRALRRDLTTWKMRFTNPAKVKEITNKRNGHRLRAVIIKLMKKSDSVKTDFILRNQFIAGAKTPKDFRKARQIYVQNMTDNMYTMCVRGDGNYSYRFYETLSCGRIPIFVDTDCVLPFDSIIDWKKYCVWIDKKEVPYIAEKVADFHAEHSQDDLIEMQHKCRQVWEDWITPTSFFKNLHLNLDQ